MRRVIHKIELDWYAGAQQEVLPSGSRILHAAVQHGKLIVWYETDLDQKGASVFRFLLRYTGNEIPETAVYLATAMTESGGHVVHIFLQPAEEPRVLETGD